MGPRHWQAGPGGYRVTLSLQPSRTLRSRLGAPRRSGHRDRAPRSILSASPGPGSGRHQPWSRCNGLPRPPGCPRAGTALAASRPAGHDGAAAPGSALCAPGPPRPRAAPARSSCGARAGLDRLPRSCSPGAARLCPARPLLARLPRRYPAPSLPVPVRLPRSRPGSQSGSPDPGPAPGLAPRLPRSRSCSRSVFPGPAPPLPAQFPRQSRGSGSWSGRARRQSRHTRSQS